MGRGARDRSRRFRLAVAGAAILGIAAAGAGAVHAAADPGGVPAAPQAKGAGLGRGVAPAAPKSVPLPDHYIVTLQPGVNADDFAVT